MTVDEGSPRDVKLAEALAALANPARIALLRQVRAPKALREIRLRPGDEPNGPLSPERDLARQSVKRHLDRLVEIGVIVPRDAHRSYGDTVEYLLNHQALFALAEEFRELARLRATADPGGATVASAVVGPRLDLARPTLVLVKGLDEGRTFDLSPPAEGKREWIIGRRRGLDVCLDFDPFVSTENARIIAEAGTYHVEDLPESRNGTLVNLDPLPKGVRHRLATGDLIGVGRSLLMFHEGRGRRAVRS